MIPMTALIRSFLERVAIFSAESFFFVVLAFFVAGFFLVVFFAALFLVVFFAVLRGVIWLRSSGPRSTHRVSREQDR